MDGTTLPRPRAAPQGASRRGQGGAPRWKCRPGPSTDRASPADWTEGLFGPPEPCKSPGALEGDQCLQPKPEQGRLLRDAGQLARPFQKPVIDIQRGSHMHQ